MTQFFSFITGLFLRLLKRYSFRRRNDMERYALVIGVERSVKFGSCPGAKRDSLQMRKLLNGVASVEYLSDASATMTAVKTILQSQIAKVPENGIFIMTYSGHGGSQRFADTKDEADGKDEYLCLYDGYLKDDDIWGAIKKCKGKVFLFFDCCHSETMFRAPMMPIILPETLIRDIPIQENGGICGMTRRDSYEPNSPVCALVWSGCPDNTYSYGDSLGGLFTNALLDAVKQGKHTYAEIWQHIKQDKSLSQYSQKPQQSILGGFDTSNQIWS